MIFSADEFDTISPGHRDLYQRPDQSKMNELFDLKRQHIPSLSPCLISFDSILKENNEYVENDGTETQFSLHNI